MEPFATTKSENTVAYGESDRGSKLLTTGSCKVAEAYHTYDVAGNIMERTDEIGINANSHVKRSASYTLSGIQPVCERASANGDDSEIYWHFGFRVVLYIK